MITKRQWSYSSIFGRLCARQRVFDGERMESLDALEELDLRRLAVVDVDPEMPLLRRGDALTSSRERSCAVAPFSSTKKLRGGLDWVTCGVEGKLYARRELGGWRRATSVTVSASRPARLRDSARPNPCSDSRRHRSFERHHVPHAGDAQPLGRVAALERAHDAPAAPARRALDEYLRQLLEVLVLERERRRVDRRRSESKPAEMSTRSGVKPSVAASIAAREAHRRTSVGGRPARIGSSTRCRCGPRSSAAPVPGYHGHWCIDTKWMFALVLDERLRAVAVVHVPIDDQHALGAVRLAARSARRSRRCRRDRSPSRVARSA